MKRVFCMFGLALIGAAATVYGQQSAITQPTDPKTTQAYCMLIERRVRVQAELETLLHDYSGDWPPAKKLQAEFDALKVETEKMIETDEAIIPRLTSGVGGLILRKTLLISEIKTLSEEQSAEWPPLKEKQRELELLDKQIQKVLS